MTRPRLGIGSELLPVFMILVCLAGTWSLIVTMHRRGAAPRKATAAPIAAPVVAVAPTVQADPLPPLPPPPQAPKPPPPPPEDPTEKALSRIARAQAEQLLEAQRADQKAEALEKARQAAVTDSQRSRRHVALVHSQIAALTDQAMRLDAEIAEDALERDVLARERDAAKAALAKARTRSSYAVLPHKGPNGTWRRPIIIECHNGMATLQPNGPSFSLLDLSSLFGPSSAPIVAAVAREVVRAQGLSTPDGAPIVPYIFFVVRPDGIRPFYNARSQLEPLGISFGYELVDQNMEIDYPDLDNLDEWDGPVTPGPGPTAATAAPRPPEGRPWPAAPQCGPEGRGSEVSPDSFVWPARPSVSASGHVGGSDGMTGGTDQPGEDPGGDRGPGELVARSASTPARNGLGRGGNGVDPVPIGVPVLDPDHPYDNTGRFPGARGSGDEARSSPSTAPPGLVPGVHSRGGEPRFGPRPGLVPVDPSAMPGLDHPDAAEGSFSGPSTDPKQGGWRPAGRATGPALGNATGNPSVTPNPSDTAPPLELPSLAPAGAAGSGSPTAGMIGGTPPSPTAGMTGDRAGTPNPGQSGSFDPNQGAAPPLSQLARLAGAAGVPNPYSGGAAGASGKPSGTNAPGISVPLSNPNGSGSDLDSDSESDTGVPGSEKGSRRSGQRSMPDRKGPLKIDVPFELVVACGPEGVVIHPGGYRISSKALKARDGLLMENLKTIVQTRRQVDPMIHPHPSVRFLVEPGGGATYSDARRQTMMAGMDWPVSLQVSDSNILDNFPREPW